MAGPILHLGSVVTCSHAGPAQPTSPTPRVTVSGQPVVTLASPYVLTGCALTGTQSPPCVSGQWVSGAVRVMALGIPVAVLSGQSVCVPTGTPLLPVSAQSRVIAT
jgi:hypothetical protein